jgi:molecular chaperone GrpE (heat shock protein)
LGAELARLDEQVKSMPADPTPKLAAAIRQLEAHQARIPRLEAEAAELTERRRVLQRELDAYRAKYPAP